MTAGTIHVSLTPVEVSLLYAALDVYKAVYQHMLAKETVKVEAKDLGNYLVAARRLGGQLQTEMTLRRGEFAVLERALRMLANARQQIIRLDMTPERKAALRRDVQEPLDLFLKIRKLQGLPS